MTHVHNANPGEGYRRRLAIVFILAAGYMVAEFTGELLSGSLALLADAGAGYMLADVGGIGLSLMAIWISTRPATLAKSYGYYRVEILAALLNGAILFAISGFILYEAIVQLQSPPEINSELMMAVAAGGVVINLAGAFLLHGGASESLNIEAAFLEVISDLIGSIGVIVAGGIILFTGWCKPIHSSRS